MAAKRKKKKETSFTTWKINLENTVNADPKLGIACLKIVRAYLDWMGSPDARPFLSIIHLRVATALAENTIIKARRELENEGYFIADGKNSAGAIRYRIVNAGENRVLDHITISRETLKRLEAEKKERERLKRAKAPSSPAENEGPLSPSENEGLEAEMPLKDCRDSPSEIEGNYVKNSVDAISTEEGSPPSYGSPSSIDVDGNAYASAQHGDESNQPLPVPRDQREADDMLDAICDGRTVSPTIRNRLMSMLRTGVLTPRMAENILGPKREAAA